MHNHTGLGGDFEAWKKKEGLDIEDNAHHFPDFTDFQAFVDKIYSYPWDNSTPDQNRERILSLYEATYELAVEDGVTYLEPGMKLKAHAGELLDAEFVRRSVEVLELDEVQHGIAAATSPDVMGFLSDNRIRLNLCPSSNIQLCQTESFKTHPMRILLDNGLKVSLNTDDTIIFAQSSCDEFFNMYGTGLYTAGELDQVRLNGFSFGKAPTYTSLLKNRVTDSINYEFPQNDKKSQQKPVV